MSSPHTGSGVWYLQFSLRADETAVVVHGGVIKKAKASGRRSSCRGAAERVGGDKVAAPGCRAAPPLLEGRQPRVCGEGSGPARPGAASAHVGRPLATPRKDTVRAPRPPPAAPSGHQPAEAAAAAAGLPAASRAAGAAAHCACAPGQPLPTRRLPAVWRGRPPTRPPAPQLGMWVAAETTVRHDAEATGFWVRVDRDCHLRRVTAAESRTDWRPPGACAVAAAGSGPVAAGAVRLARARPRDVAAPPPLAASQLNVDEGGREAVLNGLVNVIALNSRRVEALWEQPDEPPGFLGGAGGALSHTAGDAGRRALTEDAKAAATTAAVAARLSAQLGVACRAKQDAAPLRRLRGQGFAGDVRGFEVLRRSTDGAAVYALTGNRHSQTTPVLRVGQYLKHHRVPSKE
ncbi:translation initiation factor IF-2-like [Schistocerca gregaria]|uniref:translation initiation factor IF-2-like n=1 Tax=Schistocerca gregaria TaxID=7010 RepID=UPI00211EA2D3|nr:translation initiation factor IF-2-like [Schistocerca gregaria]